MHSKQFICLSVCPSVTLRYRGHIGWNTLKIISRPNSLMYLLNIMFDPIISELVQREHPQNLDGIGIRS